MQKFTHYQLRCVESLKKNIYSTKLFYDLVMKNQTVFTTLGNCKMPIKQEELTFTKKELDQVNLISDDKKRDTNPQQFGQIDLPEISEEAGGENDESEDEKDLLESNEFNLAKIKRNFEFLFDNSSKNSKIKINYIKDKRCKSTRTKLIYRETYDIVERRKAERTDSFKKKFSKSRIEHSEMSPIKLVKPEDESSEEDSDK
jgi:hypothetical protein